MEQLTDQTKLEILCAYLPYGVEVLNSYSNSVKLKASQFFNDYGDFIGIDNNAKLILRHRDDMTEAELIQLGKFLWNDHGLNNNIARENAQDWLKGYLYVSLSPQWAINSLRYLHSIHIDTFGAIESGWAVRNGSGNG